MQVCGYRTLVIYVLLLFFWIGIEETAVLDVEPIPTEEFRYRPQERGHNHINRSGYVGSRPSEVSNGFSGGGGGGYVSRYNGANQRFNGGGRGRGGASIGYNGGCKFDLA